MHPDKVKEAHGHRVRLEILKKHATFEEGYYAIKDLIEEGLGRHYRVSTTSLSAYLVFKKARPRVGSNWKLETKELTLKAISLELYFSWNLP